MTPTREHSQKVKDGMAKAATEGRKAGRPRKVVQQSPVDETPDVNRGSVDLATTPETLEPAVGTPSALGPRAADVGRSDPWGPLQFQVLPNTRADLERLARTTAHRRWLATR
jgi:hypothetical protein